MYMTLFRIIPFRVLYPTCLKGKLGKFLVFFIILSAHKQKHVTGIYFLSSRRGKKNIFSRVHTHTCVRENVQCTIKYNTLWRNDAWQRQAPCLFFWPIYNLTYRVITLTLFYGCVELRFFASGDFCIFSNEKLSNKFTGKYVIVKTPPPFNDAWIVSVSTNNFGKIYHFLTNWNI